MIYGISHKTLIDSKPLRIKFDETDEFMRIYNRARYIPLFGSEEYEAIYNRIRYLIRQKSCITYIFLTISQKLKLTLILLYLSKNINFT